MIPETQNVSSIIFLEIEVSPVLLYSPGLSILCRLDGEKRKRLHALGSSFNVGAERVSDLVVVRTFLVRIRGQEHEALAKVEGEANPMSSHWDWSWSRRLQNLTCCSLWVGVIARLIDCAPSCS